MQVIFFLNWIHLYKDLCLILASFSNEKYVFVNSQKRITPVTYETNGASQAKKANREARQLYAPPSGKFSEKAGTYTQIRGRGGFRRGRGKRF